MCRALVKPRQIDGLTIFCEREKVKNECLASQNRRNMHVFCEFVTVWKSENGKKMDRKRIYFGYIVDK